MEPSSAVKPSAATSATTPSTLDNISGKIGRYRWRICALLFFATTLNYIDRSVLGLLAPLLRVEIGWTQDQYGNIVAAFTAAYAIGLLFMGKLMDRIGTRAGYASAITAWSLAAMAHSLVRSVFGFGIARFALGLGESGNFPAAIKTVAEWFPQKERALAIGIFNAGSNVGAIIAPLAVPWIAVHFGWRWAFLFTGIFSAIWIVVWLYTYRPPQKHPRLSPAELAYIQSEPPEPAAPIPWLPLLSYKQTWAFLLGKSLTDPIWWFYLYWIPLFMHDNHGLTLGTIGLPIIVIYLMADVGSVTGGWLSGRFIKHGWSVNRSRKTAMLICAVCVIPIVFASRVSGIWSAVMLFGLATAAHQGFSANLFSLVSDVFPKRAIGSIVGIIGFGGAMGGVCMAKITGHVLQLTGSYLPILIAAGIAYLVALVVIHSLAPRLEPVVILEQVVIKEEASS